MTSHIPQKILAIVQGLLVLCMFAACLPAFAQSSQTTDYTVLAPLPGTTKGPCDPKNPTGPNCQATLSGDNNYLQGIFNLSIGIGAITAFVMITFYGFQYMFTDTPLVKKNSTEGIKNAFIGLGIVIFAYAILNTINPRLVNYNFQITNPPGTTAQVNITSLTDPCADPSSASCFSETNNRNILTTDGVTINQPCTASLCVTQVGGLTNTTVKDVAAIHDQCNCSIEITGGSEANGHVSNTTHTNGDTVDIAENSGLDKFILGSSAAPTPGYTNTVIINGRPANVLYETNGQMIGGVASTGNHWHIQFAQ